MDQISEAELTNRINTFMARKIEQFPELEKKQRRFSRELSSHEQPVQHDTHTPTFLEKINEFWVLRVHA